MLGAAAAAEGLKEKSGKGIAETDFCLEPRRPEGYAWRDIGRAPDEGVGSGEASEYRWGKEKSGFAISSTGPAAAEPRRW